MIQKISLDRLAFSPVGHRKMNRQAIKTFAARIQSGAHIESLTVVLGEEDQYYVVAGERRLAALQLLLEQGWITASYPDACRLINAKPTPEPRLLRRSSSYNVSSVLRSSK